MRIELLQGQTNVIRFPVERRAPATLDLMRELAPDVREVLNVADALDLAVDGIELRDDVDAATADYVLNHVITERGERRRQALNDILQPYVETAVTAARLAHDKRDELGDAQQRLAAAVSRGDWTGELEEQTDSVMYDAAQALVTAHVKVEEAEGAARAVGMAKRGECWIPRREENDMAWLLDAQTAGGRS